MLRSCSSPVFSRVLALEYFFEEKQPLQFHVFDAEDGATSPRNDTFLGSTECTLGQVCISTPSPTPTPTPWALPLEAKRRAELGPRLCHSSAVQPWPRHLTSLSLIFLI